MKQALLILADKANLKVYEYYKTVSGNHRMRLLKAMDYIEFTKKGVINIKPAALGNDVKAGRIDLLKNNLKKISREINRVMRKYPDIPCYFATDRVLYHELQKKTANWMRARMTKIEGADLTYLSPSRLIERFALSWQNR